MPRYTNNPLLPQIEAILADADRPMHYMEITGLLIQADAWDKMPKSPEKSVTHTLSAEIKAHGKEASVRRTAPGVYELTPKSVFEVDTIPASEPDMVNVIGKTIRRRIKKFFGGPNG